MSATATYHELFKHQAGAYAEFRPEYPDELYDAVLAFADLPHKQLALDVATGNGQVAKELARRFEGVIAIDPSAEQLQAAVRAPNVEYRQASAEATGVPDQSVDLITVGQALHWFDLPAFYTEARRVLRPHGTLAAWGYANSDFPDHPKACELTSHFSDVLLGPYWSERTRLVENKYAGCEPGPEHFAVVQRAEVPMQKSTTVAAYVGYLSSWSAYNSYRREHPDKPDPLVEYRTALLEACGLADDQQELRVVWQAFVILAKQPVLLGC